MTILRESYLGAQNLINSRVGNYNYSCPEIVIGAGYDHTVDWWAVGIMTFHFLAGITPFEASTQEETLENIIMYRANWELLPECTSNECKDFISRIISVRKSEERLGFEEGSVHTPNGTILTHDFFADIDWYSLFDGYGPLYPELNLGMIGVSASRRSTAPSSPRANPNNSDIVTSSPRSTIISHMVQSNPATSLAEVPVHQIPCFSLLTEQEMYDLPDYVAMNKNDDKDQSSSNSHHIQNIQMYRKSHHINNKKQRPDNQRNKLNRGRSNRGNSSSSGTPNDSEDDDHFNHLKHLHDGFEDFTFNS